MVLGLYLTNYDSFIKQKSKKKINLKKWWLLIPIIPNVKFLLWHFNFYRCCISAFIPQQLPQTIRLRFMFGFITVCHREGSLANLVAANRRRCLVKDHKLAVWHFRSSRISKWTSLNFCQCYQIISAFLQPRESMCAWLPVWED